MFEILDAAGTFAFAVSGSMAAMRKHFDLFGILVIAFVTASGGGTLRDVLIGNTPVSWMASPRSLVVVLLATVFAICYRKRIDKISRTLFLFDAIGLAIFVVTGTRIGQTFDLLPVICIILGTMTGCFGGIIRDILCHEPPVLLREELYASLCVLASGVYLVLQPLSEPWAAWLSILLLILLRFSAVKCHWSLPNPKL